MLLTACSFHVGATGGDGAVGDDAVGVDGAGDAPADDAATACWAYVPTNFDPCGLPGAIPLDVTGMMNLTINTDNLSAAATVRAQPGGPSVGVMHLTSLTIGPQASLTIVGTRPLILAVEGDVSISGDLVTSAGANDATACGTSQGSPGMMSGSGPASGGGGAGAGGATAGGTGGDGNNGTGNNRGAGGIAGAAVGGAAASPLRGGCRGGAGGSNNGSGTPGSGGSGGGALQISAQGTIISSAAIDASGRGATVATARTGGGGGGAGGTIFLEAPTIVVSGRLCADGGSGSEGGGGLSSGGSGGQSPCTGTSGALGSRITSFGGTPGRGAFRDNPTSGPGGAGANDGTNGGGGGGGGGGVGWIRLRAVGGTLMNSAVITPAPTQG